MAGCVRGAAALIRSSYPLAIYVHCSSHRLNLCVMKACSIQVYNFYFCNIIILFNAIIDGEKHDGLCDRIG